MLERKRRQRRHPDALLLHSTWVRPEAAHIETAKAGLAGALPTPIIGSETQVWLEFPCEAP